jgi:ribosome production factor 2
MDSVKFTRKNESAKPFESGGEASMEFYCNKSNCSLFVLGSHTKKRQHNLVFGRMFDFHLYDCLELGVTSFKSIKDFGSAATSAQIGNKVCRLPAFRRAL